MSALAKVQDSHLDRVELEEVPLEPVRFSIHDIAATYLMRSHRDRGLSTMFIHKICYITQGYYLAMTGRSLFPEEFIAKESGPFSRDLFEHTENKFTMTQHPMGDPFAAGTNPPLSQLIDALYRHYGGCTGLAISQMRVIQAQPLRVALNKGPNTVIDKADMRRLFTNLLAN